MTPTLKKLAVALLLATAATSSTAVAQNAALNIGTGQGFFGGSPTAVPITLDTDVDVQGFVLAIGYDQATISISNISDSGAATAAGAELVVPNLNPSEGGATLGVILDYLDPFDGQTIAPGTGIEIATIEVQCLVDVTSDVTTSIDFVDGQFGSPALSNVIVTNGMSFGAGQGLALGSGSFTCTTLPDAIIRAGDGAIPSDNEADGADDGSVSIEVDSSSALQGVVVALTHDGSQITLESIDRGADTQDAEFFEADTSPAGGDGGTAGIVIDFTPPFDNATLAPGTNEVAIFNYSCNNLIESPDPAVTTDLVLANGVLGSPALDNVVVVNGQSQLPSLENGSFTCLPVEIVVGDEEITYFCGPREGVGLPIEGSTGSDVEICFFYTKTLVSGTGTLGNIQGYQLAVCFDCDLFINDDFSLEGSISESVGAEFVNFSVDNDPGDGDGCELVAGVILDALPPFNGQTLPDTDDNEPLNIGCVSVTIADDPALCDTSLSVEFCNGINGGGNVAVNNIAVIDFESFQDIEFVNCEVDVIPVPEFQRADCNSDTKVDLADSIAILGQQFAGYIPLCDDACDANDDGKINLGDSVFVLNYVFKSGMLPPEPGPDLDIGPDPTEDALGCGIAECD